jgi:DNA-binding NarL/FixJ family response regulator
MDIVVVARADAILNSLQALLASIPGVRHVELAGEVDPALRWISLHQPALVLRDLYLLGDDSVTVLHEIRATAPFTRRAVLAEEVDQQAQLNAAADDVVVLKGTAPAELITVLEQLLASHPGPAGS